MHVITELYPLFVRHANHYNRTGGGGGYDIKQNNSLYLPQLPPGLPVCSCAPPSNASHTHSQTEIVIQSYFCSFEID